MSSIGHLVAKFQVQQGSDQEGDGGIEETPISTEVSSGTANVETSNSVAPPSSKSGKSSSKPAPPSKKKPVKAPPGVAMRRQKQEEADKKKEPPLRRQNSTSFTTEDLDLFQRSKVPTRRKRITSVAGPIRGPRHLAEHNPEPSPAEGSDVRRSRKDSISRSDAQSDKRRSKSVGAFAHGGLRVQPLGEKPKPPSKPKIADKPLVGRPIPSSKPVKPSKPTSEKTAPKVPTEKSQVVLRRPKTDGQRTTQPRTSRPVSGTRPTSVSKPSTGSATRPTSGSSRPASKRPSSLVKSPSTEASTPAEGGVSKTGASSQVKLRSPTANRPRPASGSRPVSGSRPASGVSDTAASRARSRPTSGTSTRTPSYIAATTGKVRSRDSEKPTKEHEPKAPQRRTSAKNTSTKRNSSVKQKEKAEETRGKVVKQRSTEDKSSAPAVSQRKKKVAEVSSETKNSAKSTLPSQEQNPLVTNVSAQSHVSPHVSPKSSPSLPPKVSPKPSLLKAASHQRPTPSPRSSPCYSPAVSPSVSPAVSPKPKRATKFASSGVPSPPTEAKAAARATIISALAGLPKKLPTADDSPGPVPSLPESPGSQESQEISVVEGNSVKLETVANTEEKSRSDNELKPETYVRKRSVGELVHKVEQLSRSDVQTVVKESSNEPKAGRQTHIHEKDSENVEDNPEELPSDTSVPTVDISENGKDKKHEHGKLHLEKYDEDSLNRAIAKAAVGKVLGGASKRPVTKPAGPPPPPPQHQAPKPDSPPSPKPVNDSDPSTEAGICALTQAPIYESPTASPVLNRTKQQRTGLTEKGHDLPVAQLIKELKEVEIAKPVNVDNGVSHAKRSPLPLRVYNNEDSASSSDSEWKNPPQSDSNDADDEEEQVSLSKRHKNQCFVKSFSTGQGDVDSNLVLVSNKRPVSSTFTVSTESTSGSDTSSLGKSKSKKPTVLERLRKLSIGLISNDNGDGEGENRKVGNAVFYQESTIAAKRTTIHVGKTKFYNTDNTSIDENNTETCDDLQEGPKEETYNSENGEKKPLIPERSRDSIQKSTSLESSNSQIVVENDNYEGSSSQPYENIMFGPIYEGIEVQKNKAGRNDLCNSSQNSVDEPPSNMENLAGIEQIKSSSVEENANIESPKVRSKEPIYDQVDELKTELNNAQIYENVEIGDQRSATRSIWRRKTLRRKTKKRPREEERGDGPLAEEDEPTGPQFENFSDSEDSFTSDSFTDESDVEEQQGITLYAPLERPKPSLHDDSDVPPMTRLQRIATELLNTEKAYVQRLHLIDQVFHFRVVIENRSHHMFPDDVIPQMFSNIKSVYQFHNDFLLPQLEKRMAEWNQTPKVGDLMKKFAPFLKLYTEYVKNFDHAMNTISTWSERSQQFANILSELQKKKECGNLTLQHHMLEPIQRVPRYELLLKDYLKHLPEGSEDEEDTKKALELVTTAASHSNEAMRKIEKFRKLLELNEKFGGTVDLIDPTRELVKEGKITKISARNGLHYERYLFLFNDMMLMCQTHVMGLLQSYRIKNLLEVDGMQVLEGDNLETPYTFYIKSKTKTIEVHTSTAGDKMEWFVAIENVIADYTRKQMSRQAGRKAMEAFKEEQLGFRAPTWVKDQNTSMCMECGSPFTMIKRRHHCRCCGIVVCAKCSSHKAPLPYLGGKTDRVCGKCFSSLSGRGERKVSTFNTHILRKKGVLQVKGSDPSVVSGMLLMSVDKKYWDKRWFALHDNYVLYSFKAPQDVHAISSLPLPGFEAEAATKDDHLDRENVIKLFHHNQKKVYYFATESNNTARWLLCLDLATKAELPPDYAPPTPVQ